MNNRYLDVVRLLIDAAPFVFTGDCFALKGGTAINLFLEEMPRLSVEIDLLVDTLPGATLFDLGGLQVDLEEMLGVPVDLLTPGDLPARFRDKVLHEAKAI